MNKMPVVTLRPQRVSDAKRFFEILTHKKFPFFERPKSLEDEIKFLKKNKNWRKKNFQHNYAILYKNKIVGGCGFKIDQHRTFSGEVGYFVDYNFQKKGIATKALKQLVKIGFNKLKLKRITLITNIRNKASIRVAEKCSFKKEGLMQKAIKDKGRFVNCYLFARVKNK
jgi:ribosomal-protein-alanine N-acetyltransferase